MIEDTYTISVVDDAPDFQTILQRLFLQACPNCQVDVFSDGKQFLNALRQMSQLPNLVLLDRHMPGLDGHQTLVHLKKHPMYQTIPVIMMSYDASELEIYDCYRAGVNSFLIKPVEFDSLKQTIQLICQYWLERNAKPITANDV